MDNAIKMQILMVPQEHTVAGVRAWVEKQVTPSPFVLEATVGHEDLFQMVAQGSGRLKTVTRR